MCKWSPDEFFASIFCRRAVFFSAQNTIHFRSHKQACVCVYVCVIIYVIGVYFADFIVSLILWMSAIVNNILCASMALMSLSNRKLMIFKRGEKEKSKEIMSVCVYCVYIIDHYGFQYRVFPILTISTPKLQILNL